jgi:hypothetical protein
MIMTEEFVVDDRNISPQEAQDLPKFKLSLETWERVFPRNKPYNPDAVFYAKEGSGPEADKIAAENSGSKALSDLYEEDGTWVIGSVVGEIVKDEIKQ